MNFYSCTGTIKKLNSYYLFLKGGEPQINSKKDVKKLKKEIKTDKTGGLKDSVTDKSKS